MNAAAAFAAPTFDIVLVGTTRPVLHAFVPEAGQPACGAKVRAGAQLQCVAVGITELWNAPARCLECQVAVEDAAKDHAKAVAAAQRDPFAAAKDRARREPATSFALLVKRSARATKWYRADSASTGDYDFMCRLLADSIERTKGTDVQWMVGPVEGQDMAPRDLLRLIQGR